MQAVILAGGKGTRLKPFTTCIPKPLIPIGDIPILEVVLRQLKYHGFKDIILSVNHQAELLMAFFGDGKKLGINITYCIEDKPLGTAGSLSIVENLQENFIVMNGDLLTTINYNNLFNYHMNNNNDATISVYDKEVKIDLGVLKIDHNKFLDYLEKPTYNFSVSMGIYTFNRRIIDYIPAGTKYDMPDLILKLNAEHKKILCYSGDYYWLDIGRVDDYNTAVTIFEERRTEFLLDE